MCYFAKCKTWMQDSDSSLDFAQFRISTYDTSWYRWHNKPKVKAIVFFNVLHFILPIYYSCNVWNLVCISKNTLLMSPTLSELVLCSTLEFAVTGAGGGLFTLLPEHTTARLTNTDTNPTLTRMEWSINPHTIRNNFNPWKHKITYHIDTQWLTWSECFLATDDDDQFAHASVEPDIVGYLA
jgi:hypothetical protein